MTVSYDEFTSAFLDKITEYNFLRMDEEDADRIVDGYRKRACAQFSEVCKYDIAHGDNKRRCYTLNGATEDEVEEIIDIVTEGMLVQWFKQHMYQQSNLELALNTADFLSYSPAELTYRLTNAYKATKREFVVRMREYSFRHGDLTTLHD